MFAPKLWMWTYIRAVKECGLWSQRFWVRFLSLLLTLCVVPLGKVLTSLSFS